MKPLIFYFLPAILVTMSVKAQQKTPSDFFAVNKLSTIGSYYYPEHWPESQWNRDLQHMKDLGFEFTHFGEFAWSRMEPEEGKFDLEWLDKAIELAHNKGLKVILCTPTPTPPAWLSNRHPDILMVDENGRKMQHGARQHISWSSDTYRHYSEVIVSKLAERYGEDPRIWGWQLDNEPSHYNSFYDYGAGVKQHFRDYLKSKYPSIKALNDAWGASFWSQEYNNFEQIELPNQQAMLQPANPHALVDFQEFSTMEMADFLRQQILIIRKHANEKQFITTNYMLWALPHIEPWHLKSDLDFASYTNYPCNSYAPNAGGDLGFRLGNGYGIAFEHDFAQSINGYTGIMELQPGQINWSEYNAQPYPGAARLWIWHTIALGARFVCNYRFRQPLFCNEQYHQGILLPDGQTLSRGGQEYTQVIKELRLLEKDLRKTAKKPLPVTVLWDQRSQLDMYNYPHSKYWNAKEHLTNWHKTLKQLDQRVTFQRVSDPLDITKSPFVVAPAIQLLTKETIEKWKKYVEDGGELLITCRTGQKDGNGHLWEDSYQGVLADLIGANISFNDQLPPDRKSKLAAFNQTFSWSTWGEVLAITDENTQIMATFEDEFYKGKPALITRKIGKGNVTYIGVESHQFELEKALIEYLLKAQQVPYKKLPPYVFHEQRGNYHFILNYTSKNYTPNFNVEKRQIVIGKTPIEPAGVLIWKE